MPGIPSEEVGRSVFNATKDTATGSPLWLVGLGIAVSLFAGWANANKDAIKENPTMKIVVMAVCFVMISFLIWLMVKFWP